ncbi:hypothetical protein WMY93_033361 [Mugilogobius chulae]|uniref:Secreted protein n=1 Tax=Mugilogobius chulae TaxID=88201 RepID=A0AAW0MH84_9GOBI
MLTTRIVYVILLCEGIAGRRGSSVTPSISPSDASSTAPCANEHTAPEVWGRPGMHYSQPERKFGHHKCVYYHQPPTNTKLSLTCSSDREHSGEDEQAAVLLLRWCGREQQNLQPPQPLLFLCSRLTHSLPLSV